ncbi:MAG TPA: hypothetical protein VH879_03265 [Gemmatimonadales bacterium]|jgi:hypothetical protein
MAANAIEAPNPACDRLAGMARSSSVVLGCPDVFEIRLRAES